MKAGGSHLSKRSIRAALMLCVGIVCAAGTAQSAWQYFTAHAGGLAAGEVSAIVEDSHEQLWFGTGGGGVSRYDGLNWHTFTTEDGLASDYVQAALEDRHGNLWFGTWDGGVSRYDGVSWRTYTTADGLADNCVTAILEDRNGNLWFGTAYGGVSCFDGASWRTYTRATGLGSNYVLSMLEDRDGNIWFGTFGDTYDGGVSRFDGVGWDTYTTAHGLAGDCVFSIMQDDDGALWFGTAEYPDMLTGAVSRFDGGIWTTYEVMAGGTVYAMLKESDGDLWFGTMSGLANRYDGARWRTYTEPGRSASVGVPVNQVVEDHNGNLWFATDAGVTRFDGVSWRTYTSADGLAGSTLLTAVVEDRNGGLWFGTYSGVSLHFGGGWRTYTTADGLASNAVTAAQEDRNGHMWFGTWGGGVSRFTGALWSTYTTADGLAGNYVNAIVKDHSGNLWFGTTDGVSRYDGVSWHTFRTADGLAQDHVWAILEDRSGTLWFGTYYGGVSRYDGVNWHTYTGADGLGGDNVRAIAEDSSGNLWFGTDAGVSRFDGTSWNTGGGAGGLPNGAILSILEDSAGNLWFGTASGVGKYDGVSFQTEEALGTSAISAMLEDRHGDLWFEATCHEPDRVAPQTVIWPQPPGLSGYRTQTIAFTPAFGVNDGTWFSCSFDGASWSDWSLNNSWHGKDLSDGQHVFKVRARDKFGNVDRTPAVSGFEIDATPPTPVITLPASGQAVRDSFVVIGTATDLRYRSHRLDVRSTDAVSWDTLSQSLFPVVEDTLCGWNTAALTDGSYELRLSVTDTLGLAGSALVRVIVDNHAPWAHETAPATVAAALGGHIYTTNGEAHLYFPPHAFARDAEVGISPLADADVPDTLSGGVRRILAGYEISWGSSTLEKAATLELSLAGAGSSSENERLVLYFLGAGSSWERLGGTVEASGQSISSAVSEAGRYAVFAEGAEVSGSGGIGGLALTPRVFSPGGSFANSQAAVSFVLGRSGEVTVRVYNRAGRLVREVVSGQYLGAGTNVVRWDGRDEGGAVVAEGLYLVSVEALGQKQVKTVSVVK